MAVARLFVLRSFGVIALATAVVAVGLSSPVFAAPSAVRADAAMTESGAASSAYQPVSPVLFVSNTKVAARGSTTVYPLGEGNFPTTGPSGAVITALTIDMSALSTTSASGDLELYSDSSGRPNASDVQFGNSLASTDTVVVAPGSADGGVLVYNNSSAATTIALTSIGYYYAQPAGTGGFVPEAGGAIRILDTRKGSEPRAGAPFNVQVTGTPSCSGTCVAVAGVPANATAVAVNVTAVGQRATTSIKVWAQGAAQPVAVEEANPDGAVADFDQVALGTGSNAGGLTLMTDLSAANILLDIEGYYTTDSAGAQYVPISDTRIVDSRSNTGSPPLTSSTPQTVQVAGTAGVPATAVAVVAIITVVKPPAVGDLTAGPTSAADSVVNFPSGSNVANTDDLTLNDTGAAVFGVALAAGGSTQLQYLVDILGYYDAPHQ
jgi:hypothetical protein